MAVMPESGSIMFSNLKAGLTSPETMPPPGGGRWYRAFPGYFFIGSEGGDHHYQHDPPAGIDVKDMVDDVTLPGGEIERLLDDLIAQVEIAAAGGPVQFVTNDGQPTTLDVAPADQQGLQSLMDRLKRTREACRPDYNQAIVRQINSELMGKYFSSLGEIAGDPANLVAMLRPGTAAVLDLRWRFAADSRLLALFYVQSQVSELAEKRFQEGKVEAGPVLRQTSMSMESGSVGHDPEQMLAQIIKDTVSNGLGDVLDTLCDQALTQAQTEVDSALNATDLPTYEHHLYAATHLAFAGMRLAEAYQSLIPEADRPRGANDRMLNGYATNLEEIVVRAAQALTICCINRGSGEAIRVHVARLRLMLQAGDADTAQRKVKEWVEEYYFYPRYYAAALLKDAGFPPEPPMPTPGS